MLYTADPEIPKLTPEQQAMVVAAIPLAKYFARRRPNEFAQRIGRDGVYQEAYLGACYAALQFDPAVMEGRNWKSYAARGIWSRLRNLMRDSVVRIKVWNDWSHWNDGRNEWDEPVIEPVEHRPPGTILAVWCSPDERHRRRNLIVRHRVILYLISVEGWSGSDVARYFGVRKTFINRVIRDARERMTVPGL